MKCDYTDRASRTMAEAFGPYTSHHLSPMPDKRPTLWRQAAGWIALVAVMALIGALMAA